MCVQNAGKKRCFTGQKRFFNLFHVFQYYIHELFVSLIMLERSCTIIPDTQPIKNQLLTIPGNTKGRKRNQVALSGAQKVRWSNKTHVNCQFLKNQFNHLKMEKCSQPEKVPFQKISHNSERAIFLHAFEVLGKNSVPQFAQEWIIEDSNMMLLKMKWHYQGPGSVKDEAPTQFAEHSNMLRTGSATKHSGNCVWISEPRQAQTSYRNQTIGNSWPEP